MHDRGLLFNTLKKAGAHSLIYGMGMSFTAISSILLVPLYTKSLTPADYGIYSLISIIASLLFFLYDFGMINAVFRWYYQYSPDQSHLRRRVISTALLFLFGLALFFTILLWVFAPFLSRVVLHSDKFAPFIRLMLLGVFLQSLTWVPLSLLRIKEKVLTFTSITVLGMIVMVIANYLFLSMGRGIGGIYEAYIIAYIFVGVFLYLKTHQNYAIEFSLTELKGMLKFGVPYLPVLFFSWMIDFSDRYLLGRLSTLQEVGLYSVGYKLGQVMYMVEKTFLIAWIPLMLSIYQQHKDKAQHIFGGVFTYFSVAIFILALSISVFSSEIIRIFTSPAYYGAAAVVPWVAFAYLLSGIYIFMLSGFIISKNVYLQPVILFLSALVNIGLNIVLIPKFGMMGAAYATVVSYLIVAVFTTVFSQKLYPINIEWVRIAKVAVCAVVIYFLSRLVNIPSMIMTVMLKTALIAFLFVALYFTGFFNASEIKRFRNILVSWRLLRDV